MSRVPLLFIICITSGNVVSDTVNATGDVLVAPQIGIISQSLLRPIASIPSSETLDKTDASVTQHVLTDTQRNRETFSSGKLPSDNAPLHANSSIDISNTSVSTTVASTSITAITSTNITSTPAINSISTISTSNTTTTTPSLPTTTAVPFTPLHPAKLGNWTFGDKNQTCIMIQMAVEFNVSYMTTMNKTSFLAFNLPPNNETKVVNGSCGKIENYIVLSWNTTSNATNNFTLHFMKNTKQSEYSLHHFEVALAAANLPDYNSKDESLVLMHNTSHFSVGLSNSYKCKEPPKLDLTNLTNNVVGNVTITQLQFQAFRSDNSTQFGAAKDCIFDTPDIVPIAVGCALAGLVVIVLIAYLVGRKRSQVRGYSSM